MTKIYECENCGSDHFEHWESAIFCLSCGHALELEFLPIGYAVTRPLIVRIRPEVEGAATPPLTVKIPAEPGEISDTRQ